ncbi:MAG: hypothetical protein ABIJ65_07380 [Chloroflexota bacterium]
MDKLAKVLLAYTFSSLSEAKIGSIDEFFQGLPTDPNIVLKPAVFRLW